MHAPERNGLRCKSNRPQFDTTQRFHRAVERTEYTTVGVHSIIFRLICAGEFVLYPTQELTLPSPFHHPFRLRSHETINDTASAAQYCSPGHIVAECYVKWVLRNVFNQY